MIQSGEFIYSSFRGVDDASCSPTSILEIVDWGAILKINKNPTHAEVQEQLKTWFCEGIQAKHA